MPPKVLIALGDAWVDPAHVIGVDTTFTDEDPSWANVKVILDTGQEVCGMRAPARVVAAIRHPELDAYDEETGTEIDGAEPPSAAERARRRSQAATVGGGTAALRPFGRRE
jgi:hypothetical protein